MGSRATNDTPAKRLRCNKCGMIVDGGHRIQLTQKGKPLLLIQGLARVQVLTFERPHQVFKLP
jgi:hypothetical protein